MAAVPDVTSLNDNEVSEHSPLLASSPAVLTSVSASDHYHRHHRYRDMKEVRYIFRLGLLIIFLVASSQFLLIAPITQLKELAICKSYYRARWEPLSNCKAEPIQSALASLIGWQQLLDCFPGIFYGSLADHYGRRLVLVLSLLGMSFGAIWIQVVLFWSEKLPIELTWISAAFYLVGGGQVVGGSMIFVVVSDISSDEESAQTKDLWLLRASTFSMALGSFAIGLAPNAIFVVIGITLFALGHGFTPILLSLASTLVDSAHVGMLYNVLARIFHDPRITTKLNDYMRRIFEAA
ncbi:hypothetical protein SS1G_13638 [Sclerotinia sclerotiorum 1980 UF-70]|uniref:Major facilitator superfamily (MFS) profile domain-containing protein n=1 Tax=Sclerotinia sclerotiorum (strain ATCC 18683 / 1980 / Ss-1) TaxID=665079 RepID=A7F7Q8_SCLS1|nr:hypothetical protein SS1G_13638 [Sclerotinia sclerotiorum 1980 UF-70]EDN98779.1 hypothetical protein SS1G_13638 [Sclerotinia sclerotiorum 1980 UF-70]